MLRHAKSIKHLEGSTQNISAEFLKINAVAQIIEISLADSRITTDAETVFELLDVMFAKIPQNLITVK